MNEFYNRDIQFGQYVPQNIKDWLSSSHNESTDHYPYKFGVFSDLHITTNGSTPDKNNTVMNGYQDLLKALSCSINNGIEFLCTCGDVGTSGLSSDTSSSSKRVLERELYKNAINDSQLATMFKIKQCAGNHDSTLTTEQWKEKTGCDWCHTYYHLNEVFVFISIKHQKSANGMLVNAYEDSDIDYLENVLNNNPNKRIFVFMHFPLNSESLDTQYAGLLKSTSGTKTYSLGKRIDGIYYYGFDKDTTKPYNEQNKRIIDIFKNYTGHIIFFCGHSHFCYETEDENPNIKHSIIGDNVDMFLVTSLNQPRDNNANVIWDSSHPEKQPVQGYNVTVYNDKVIVNGYEFNFNQKLQRPINDPIHGEIIRTYEINVGK